MKNVLEHIKVNHIFHLDKSKMDITYFHHRFYIFHHRYLFSYHSDFPPVQHLLLQ